MRRLRAGLDRMPRSSSVNCQVLITGSGANRPFKNVAGRERRARGLHRRPGEPIAPHRDGRDQLAVSNPGDRPVDRGAAGLVGKQSGDLRVGEGLNEAHARSIGIQMTHDSFPTVAATRADGEQHQRRHAARHPEGAGPVDAALQPRALARRISAAASPLVLTCRRLIRGRATLTVKKAAATPRRSRRCLPTIRIWRRRKSMPRHP